MNKLLKEYVDTVAGVEVSKDEANNFIKGLEDFYTHYIVSYDIDEEGYLRNKAVTFSSFQEAFNFGKQVKSFTKPVIHEEDK